MEEQDKNIVHFNKRIDAKIFGSKWHIDPVWGMQRLNKYISDVETFSPNNSGFGELISMYKEMKHEQRARILCVGEDDNFEEVEMDDDLSKRDISKGAIARLQLNGVMQVDSDWCTRGVRELCLEIDACNNHEKISGILLEVNSGGGESLAGQMLQNALIDSRIPVVVYAHFIGSAAVRGTLPSEKIILAGKGTEMGSIGSMISIRKSMIEFYKKNIKDIYSKKSPEKNKAFRELLKGNEKPLVERVTRNDEVFMAEVEEFRDLDPSTKDSTLKGDMFPAEDAIQRGLADSIGTMNDAIGETITQINSKYGGRKKKRKKKDEVQSNNSLINKNSTVMLENIISHINRILGTNIATDATQTDVETVLAEQTPLQERVDSAVAGAMVNFNKQFNQVNKSLESANAKIKSLEEAGKESSQSSADTTKGIKDLTEKIDALSKKNDTLSQEIAALKAEGNPPPAEANSGIKGKTVQEVFEGHLDALQEVEGESSY